MGACSEYARSVLPWNAVADPRLVGEERKVSTRVLNTGVAHWDESERGYWFRRPEELGRTRSVLHYDYYIYDLSTIY